MGDDATIGVPKANSESSDRPEAEHTITVEDLEESPILDDRDDVDESETCVSVYVPNGTDWEEVRLAPGEPMEVTIPTRDGGAYPVAYVEVDEDLDPAGDDETNADD